MQMLLIGCGGYGAGYVRELLSPGVARDHEIAGIVDPYAAGSPVYDQIVARGIPIYAAVEDFYREHQVPLAVISTPIGLHPHDAEACFKNGSHVLLEKPIAATADLARRIISAARNAGKKLGVGFQLCYDPAMLRLKAEIDAGALGKPVFLRAIILWQRTRAYYARSGGWAGKKQLPDGTPVNDSILTNATAHYLMNMLWLTTPGYKTLPALGCEAQLGRAYPIETFDTAAARFDLPCGCPGMIFVSHVAGPEQEQNPLMEYTFEKGVVQVTAVPGRGLHITVRDAVGGEREIGYTNEGVGPKLAGMIRAIEEDAPLTCPGEAALSSVLSNLLVFRHDLADVEKIQPVIADDEKIWAPGVGETLRAAYAARQLPKEMGRLFSAAQ